ncbi:MAG TPA: DNA primase [Candidatus Paceibacterota bacterium]
MNSGTAGARMGRSQVEDIKQRLPIEDVVGSYIKLEKSGKAFKAKCPFHHEKTASFYVSPDRGGYYCFGCNAKGDIFTFVEQFEGLDFKGALKVLADRAGVSLVFDQKTDTERDRLFRIMEDATKYFQEQLAKSAEAKAYIEKRGLTAATVSDFRIGFAPEGWRNLFDYLVARKWPKELIERAGLAKKAEDTTGNYYDRFRGRVMFPIADTSGRVIAFTGRILPKLDDGKAAKYLNSPDTPIFDKSAVLFGLDKAKNAIRLSGYSILVEGQMDLIMSHQAGIKNVVASSGTALADSALDKHGVVNNLGLLKRLSNNLLIAFDSDAAGRKAAMRAAGIALSLGMDVKIADIVGGKDPADLVLENPENWKNILRNNTKPVIEFEIGSVLKEVTEPRKVPKALRDRVFPFIALIESETDKAFFVRMVADRAGLPEQAVWDDVKTIVAKIAAENAAASSGSSVPVPPKRSVPISADPTLGSRRIDLVERRMFGLLEVMQKAQQEKATEYAAQIERVAGDSYAQRRARADAQMGDLVYEAEAFFGTQPQTWDAHMRDLIVNFEEDLVAEELIKTMTELRQKERAGDHAAVSELAKKCQALSVRKAEIAKLRR